MKRLLKFGITLSVAAMMVVVGVLAAIRLDFKVTSSVSFTAEKGILALIDATTTKSTLPTTIADADFDYEGATYTVDGRDNSGEWNPGNIEFDKNNLVIYYIVMFSNNAVDSVNAALDIDATFGDLTRLDVKYAVHTASEYDERNAEQGDGLIYIDVTSTIDQTTPIDTGVSAVFVLRVELTDTNTDLANVSIVLDFNLREVTAD